MVERSLFNNVGNFLFLIFQLSSVTIATTLTSGDFTRKKIWAQAGIEPTTLGVLAHYTLFQPELYYWASSMQCTTL